MLNEALTVIGKIFGLALTGVSVLAVVKLVYFFGRGTQRLDSINDTLKEMKVSIQASARHTNTILVDHAKQLSEHKTDIAVLKERTGWLGQADGVSP